MSINLRFRKVLEYSGLTAYALAKEIGVTSQTIANISTGKTTPKADILINLTKSFPQINGDWLLTGQGEMLRIQSSNKTELVVEKQQSSDILDRLERVVAENALLKREIIELKARLGE